MSEDKRTIVRVIGVTKTFTMGKMEVQALKGVDLEIFPENTCPSWGRPVPASPPCST